MRNATLIAACAILAGCANIPHNNVLLFGTDTKVALDISSAATQGGAPQITLGYRRAEAVWMPLVANNQTCDDDGNCRTETALNGKNNNNDQDKAAGVAIMTGVDFKTGNGRDAYSVFASFGAKFSGQAGVGDVGASGGLAQFFATGIAAQRLAENPGVVTALKVGSAPEAAARTAEAEAKIAVSDVERARIAQEQAVLALNNNQRATKVLLACGGGPQGDKTKWTAAVNANPGLNADDKAEILLASSNTSAVNLLATDPAVLEAFEINLTSICPS